MIYQLSKHQFEILHRMANISEEEPLLTVVFPVANDDEDLRRNLLEARDSAQDLEGLGFLRYDDEDLIKIASEVALKLERPVRVYTLTKVGRMMFHRSEYRAKN